MTYRKQHPELAVLDVAGAEQIVGGAFSKRNDREALFGPSLRSNQEGFADDVLRHIDVPEAKKPAHDSHHRPEFLPEQLG